MARSAQIVFVVTLVLIALGLSSCSYETSETCIDQYCSEGEFCHKESPARLVDERWTTFWRGFEGIGGHRLSCLPRFWVHTLQNRCNRCPFRIADGKPPTHLIRVLMRRPLLPNHVSLTTTTPARSPPIFVRRFPGLSGRLPPQHHHIVYFIQKIGTQPRSLLLIKRAGGIELV